MRFIYTSFIVYSIIVVLLWNSKFLTPLKIFVVYWHELMHAISSILTGGKVFKFAITPYESGITYISGGNPIIIYSAGYLGTMLIGSLLILGSSQKGISKRLISLLGILTILLAWIWGKGFFTIVYATIAGIALIGINYIPSYIGKQALRFLGTMFMLYSIMDLKELYMSDITTDATLLSNITGIPKLIIAISWSLINLLIFAMTIWIIKKLEKSIEQTKQE